MKKVKRLFTSKNNKDENNICLNFQKQIFVKKVKRLFTYKQVTIIFIFILIKSDLLIQIDNPLEHRGY